MGDSERLTGNEALRKGAKVVVEAATEAASNSVMVGNVGRL